MGDRVTQEASIEYGVRVYGGHVFPKVSRHAAIREIEDRVQAGEKNVWLVKRQVSDWEMA